MSPEEILILIRRVLVGRFGFQEREIDEAKTLGALGVDSLSGLELMFEIEDQMNLRLPIELLSLDKSLRELAENLSKFADEHQLT